MPTFITRAERTDRRQKAFTAVCRAKGMGAMDTALAAVDVAFGQTAQINSHKLFIERLIRMSYGHPEVRARFRYYAEIICANGFDLDQACRLLRDECAARRPGECIRLPSMIRTESHLILRWLRFKRMHTAFAEMVAAERHELLRRHVGAIHQDERLEAAE